MSTQNVPHVKSPTEEPPNPANPDSERRRKRKRSNGVENPEPRPRRDNPSPEIPHDPQDVPSRSFALPLGRQSLLSCRARCCEGNRADSMPRRTVKKRMPAGKRWVAAVRMDSIYIRAALFTKTPAHERPNLGFQARFAKKAPAPACAC